MDISKAQRAVCTLDDPNKIKLVADIERSEILHMLSRRPMTETQLAEGLRITKAAVGYHLKLLMDEGLIKIERQEAEEHGILQKYYEPIARVFIIDPDHLPDNASRNFIIKTQMDRIKGSLDVFQLYENLHGRSLSISSEFLENATTEMLKQVRDVARKYEMEETVEEGEIIETRIHAEALKSLIKKYAHHKRYGRLGTHIIRLLNKYRG